MRGTNHLLALTTTVDEITGEVKPLFSFPVQVAKASDDGGDVKFDNAAPSGAEYEVKYVDTATGETFDYAERQRGIKVGEEFRPIDADAIDAINDATKIPTMVALGRIPLAEAWAKYGDRITGRYYLQVPAKGGSATAYRLTYESLREEKKGKKVTKPAQAIVTKRTARSRQKLALIYADEDRNALVLVELLFSAAVREPDEQVTQPVATAEVEQAMIEKARQIIDNLPEGEAVLETEVDEAVALKAELVEKAIQGEEVVAPKQIAKTSEADSLADALEKSLAAV